MKIFEMLDDIDELYELYESKFPDARQLDKALRNKGYKLEHGATHDKYKAADNSHFIIMSRGSKLNPRAIMNIIKSANLVPADFSE